MKRFGESLLFSAEHSGFHKLTDDVADEDMAFLDARGVFGRHVEQDVGIFLHQAAGLAGHGDDLHAHLLSHLESLEDILGIAGGGDAHDDVAGLGSAAQEAREDEVVAVVVAHGGEVGGVAVEGLGVEGRAVEVEASGEFGGEVLRVGGTATVAAEMDLAAAAQRRCDHLRRAFNAAQKVMVVQYRLLRGDGFGDGLGNAGIHYKLWFEKRREDTNFRDMSGIRKF